MAPQLTKTITRPYSKLTRLCQEAARRGGLLTTFAAVASAKQVDLTPGRVTQMFGYAREADGVIVKPETVGHLVAAFNADGVPCEIEWLYLDFDEFAKCIAGAPMEEPTAGLPSAEWELRRGTVMPDLVELSLHPRPANEPDTHYVDATLLFGTAIRDFDPEDGGDPRMIAIALRDAALAIGSEAYQPVRCSMLGERVTSENFKRAAGGIALTGTLPDGTLQGNPIGDEHLAIIGPTHTGDDPFEVTVTANRGSFHITERDTSPGADLAPTVNKHAILNAFIYRRCEKDKYERAVLAKATMKRREPVDPII